MTAGTESGDEAPDIICAENIALLSLLHRVPVRPSIQPIIGVDLRTGRGTRTLAIDRESRLVGALALLTNLSDDSDCVTAASIIENHKDDRLDVLVSVNRAKVRQGGAYLENVASGMRKVLEILSRVSDRNEPHIEAEVFTAVVAVLYERIVARLRLVKLKKNQKGHLKGKSKASLRDSLQTACNAVHSRRRQLDIDGLGQTAEAFLAASKPMLASLQSFENHRTISQLEPVIDEALRWSQSSDFERLFIAIPAQVINPQLFPALLRNSRKIAQYRVASRDLYRVARKCPLLRRALITKIDLGPEAFVRQRPAQYQPDLGQTLERILPDRAQMSALAKFLKDPKKENAEDPKTDFKTKVNRILKESRIHAEVQILAYLEDKRPPLPPRVIRSSKKACFLCNSLFGLQKTYSIPHSHGRLYDGWRMPRMVCLDGLHQRLNDALQLQARDSIQFLLQKKGPIGYPDPYESSALGLSHSATTVNTVTTGGVSVSRVVQLAVENVSKPASEPTSEGTDGMEAGADAGAEDKEKEYHSSDSEVELQSSMSESTETGSPAVSNQDNSVSTPSSAKSDSEPSPWRKVPLAQGHIYSHKLSSGGETCLYTLGKQFELHIEHVNIRASSSSAQKPLRYEIKWLDPEEAHSLRQHGDVTLVDTRALSSGDDTNVSGQKPIYMVSGGEMVQLKIY